ncbi:inositol monophosphatase family protein [Granulicoccus sp. GXG6511]|uniref:inositol monophosphatase family protein n=1 Tax=Granulicoccus sp. GXG6511 TaxID=3381351 RepID=UPI003D7E37F5
MTGSGLTTEQILLLMQETAEEVIRPRWRALADDDISEKNPGDFVTVADHEAEVRISALLHAAYPDALIVGEEATAADPGAADLVHDVPHAFVIDPVDGTRNFIHGRKDYAVMVGELRSGEITRGWIWQPELDRAWVAELGSGATCNDQPVTLPTPDLAHVRGATTHRRLLRRRPAGVEELGWTFYACGIDYPNIALGIGDFLIYRHMKPWDHVPGSLILREAGGISRTIDGRDYRAEPTDEPLVVAVNEETWEIGRRCITG